MNETLTRVLTSLSDPSSAGPDMEDVEALVREYPFFVLPAVVALRRKGAEIDQALREKLMSIIALNSPDPQTMFMLADVAYEDWIHFYPQSHADVTTDDAIAKFLENYGRIDSREEALLERLIFNPTPDYSSILAREEERDLPAAPTDPTDTSQDAIINSFILNHKDDESDLLPTASSSPDDLSAASPTPDRIAAASPSSDSLPAASHSSPAPVVDAHAATHRPAPAPVVHDTSLSESLAKIYIRQKRYDKAFEIIHTLSLNNPKKSAYFADQLRFLRKLILNRNCINNNK